MCVVALVYSHIIIIHFHTPGTSGEVYFDFVYRISAGILIQQAQQVHPAFHKLAIKMHLPGLTPVTFQARLSPR
ncbi:hypothetical protein BJY00DRAFT_290507 [Aspergillus carlsbadensis]|nr:hypothetical protein BJY00DRAFT_290507 [Aspergillus carlsbadensis]